MIYGNITWSKTIYIGTRLARKVVFMARIFYMNLCRSCSMFLSRNFDTKLELYTLCGSSLVSSN